MVHDKFDEDIARVGWSCMGVGGGEDSLPFIYTIGLHLKGLPELLVIGGIGPSLHSVVNESASRMVAGGAFTHGQRIGFGGEHSLVAVHCDSPDAWDEYTIQAASYYGHRDYKVIQLVLCDQQGRYPWDSGCADPYARQPVLGPTPGRSN
jgi:hypothetical protein